MMGTTSADPAELRRNRAARSRTWVTELERTDPDAFGELADQLVAKLDAACRKRLSAGEAEVFGAVADLRAVFDDWLIPERLPGQFTAAERRAFTGEAFTALLARLVDAGDIVFVHDRQRARSRAFETVHYLRRLKQRTSKREGQRDAPRLVEMVKVETRRREQPNRTVSIEAMANTVEDVLFGEADPAATINDLDPTGLADVLAGIFRDFLTHTFGDTASFAPFQQRALEEALGAAFGQTDAKSALVVAAGTGFGKTEAFLLPILVYAAYATAAMARQGRLEGADALLVYPRVDLCDDQAHRLLRYIVELNALLKDRWGDVAQAAPFRPLRVAVAHGRSRGDDYRLPCPLCDQDRSEAGAAWKPEDEDYAWLVVDQQTQRFRCQRRGSEHAEAAGALVRHVVADGERRDLVITTLDTLHRLLMDRRGQRKLFGHRLVPPRLVVIDEMHIYEGQAGAHAANICRRLRQRVRGASGTRLDPVLIGASATVGHPKDLACRLFGLDPSLEPVALIEPTGEAKPASSEYFLFIQSPGNRLLIDGATDRPDTAAASRDDGAEELLEHAAGDGTGAGTRRFVAEQATMIQAAMCLSHTMKSPAEGMPPLKRRVLGFVDSIDVAVRLARNLDNAEWQESLTQASGLRETPLYALRYPTGRPEASEGGPAAPLQSAISDRASMIAGTQPPQLGFPLPGLDCPRRESRNCRQPPHHLQEMCHRYAAGECWHTMASAGEEGLAPLAIQVHRSGQRAWAHPAFAGNFVWSRDAEAWRLLITTSALEVGFDHSELIATWQYHAPPSLTAFLQRKGRGGRGRRDAPITMMVLGPGGVDSFAFHNQQQYVEVDQADLPTTLDAENPSIRTQHIVAALFDFCAAQGETNAYGNIRLDIVRHALNQQRIPLKAWLQGCFTTVPPSEIDRVLDRFLRVIDALAVPIGRPFAGVRDMRPDRLFAEMDKPGLTALAAQAAETPGLETVAQWLRALAVGRPPYAARTTIDFLAAVVGAGLPTPSPEIEDPELRIPVSTVTEPIGRHIRMVDRQNHTSLEPEAAEFALNTYLPGGFKIRYGNRLWMAPWQASHRAVPRENLSVAALAVSAPGAPAPSGSADLTSREALRTLGEALSDCDLPPRATQELLDRFGGEAIVALVEELAIEDMGVARTRRFFLNQQTLAISPRKDDPTAPWQDLVRDPHLNAQRVLLPLRRRGSSLGETLREHKLPAVSRAAFAVRQELLALYHANLVHCYPKEDDARTIVVTFCVAESGRRLLPAARLRTQAIDILLDPAAIGVTPWSMPAQARTFWRRLTELIGERLVNDAGRLRNSWIVSPAVEMLRALEVREGEFLTTAPSARELGQRLAAIEHEDPSLPDLSPLAGDLEPLIVEAAAWTFSEGKGRAFADTLAVALVRAAARRLGISPLALRRHVERHSEGWRLLIFDDAEGGNGNARRLYEELPRWPEVALAVAAEADCPTARGDRLMEALFGNGHDADTLALARTQGGIATLLRAGPAAALLPPEGEDLDVALRLRLERLVEDSILAAFNLYAFSERRALEVVRGGPPRLWQLRRQVGRSPALDPRAALLRQRFREDVYGAAEIGPRLRALLPLCEGSCPDCLGLEDRGTISFADRCLLMGLA